MARLGKRFDYYSCVTPQLWHFRRRKRDIHTRRSRTIVTRPVGTQQELEARRRLAVALLELGHSASEVADVVGVAPESVCRWKEMYDEQGSVGLNAKPHVGPSMKLSEEHFPALADLLQQGPQAHGFETDRWTLDRIRVVIEKEFGVAVSRTTAWRYMQRIDWSCQKPQRRARERDEAAVEKWLNETVPALKKSATERPTPRLH